MKNRGIIQPTRMLSLWFCLLGFVLAGCTGIPLDEQAPADFDLNGHWLLDSDQSDPIKDGRGFRTSFMNQDFPLLVALEMRIEQDARSMGIEYVGGSYRDVTWGERRRGVWKVRAGWHEGALHIYSEAPDTSAVEIWQLSEDGRSLLINIEVEGERTRKFRRRFRRSERV